MTLRDQFAINAPPRPLWFNPKLPVKPGCSGELNPNEGWELHEINEFRDLAWPYYWADQMMKNRDENGVKN